jgi:hypothetical protein
MTSLVNYTMTYGFVCIFMGPGSMLLHISMTASGGLGDGMSMYMFMGFWISYNVVRLLDKCRLFFYSLFFGIVIVATGLNLFMLTSATLAPMTRKIMLGLGVAAAVSQICVWASSKIKTEDFFHGWGYFLLSAGFFVAAFIIWGLTFTGSPLCLAGGAAGTPFTPSSPIQGHAFWHILAAAGVFTMYFYFQHQKEPELNPCPPGFPRLHFTVSEAPPAGPGVDADPPEMHPGDRLPEIKFKPVKFTDGSLGSDEARPWSFRKYASDNQSLGLPALPDDEALLYPKGGEHTPPEAIEGPEPPGAPQQAPSAQPATAAAAAAPSSPSPSMPSGMPPSGGTPSIPSDGGTPPDIPQ